MCIPVQGILQRHTNFSFWKYVSTPLIKLFLNTFEGSAQKDTIDAPWFLKQPHQRDNHTNETINFTWSGAYDTGGKEKAFMEINTNIASMVNTYYFSLCDNSA